MNGRIEQVSGQIEQVSYSKYRSRTWIMAVVWTAILVLALGAYVLIALMAPVGTVNIPIEGMLFATLIVVSWFMGKSLTKEFKRKLPEAFLGLLDDYVDSDQYATTDSSKKTVPDDGKGA